MTVNSLQILREADVAKSLLLNIKDVIGDDEQAKEDAIEGETRFHEVAETATARLAEISALSDAIKARKDALSQRLDRLAKQEESIRTALCVAMADLELVKLELSEVTISRKAVPPKVVVTDEQSIPAEYFKRADPKLDKAALLKALKGEQVIPGAELSNGGETIQIRGG